MTRPELPNLDGAEREYQDMEPMEFMRMLGRKRVPKNWNELTDELDRQYDEQQEVQKEHERKQKNS